MLVSPFTFYRGAAAIKANDLAVEKNFGITVQTRKLIYVLVL